MGVEEAGVRMSGGQTKSLESNVGEREAEGGRRWRRWGEGERGEARKEANIEIHPAAIPACGA